jgi:hypothetical protein
MADAAIMAEGLGKRFGHVVALDRMFQVGRVADTDTTLAPLLARFAVGQRSARPSRPRPSSWSRSR